MATSGTYTFNMDIGEIILEALAVCGKDHTTSYDAVSVKRSLDLLLADLQNYGVPLGKLVKRTLALTASTSLYTLPVASMDIYSATIEVDTVDLTLSRISVEEYQQQPKKEITGRPTSFMVLRRKDSTQIQFWPVPDKAYTFEYWSLDRIEDSGLPTNTLDISTRYLPAIVHGLAYFMSMKMADIPMDKRQELKMTYMEMADRAFNDDSERTSFRIVPYNYYQKR